MKHLHWFLFLVIISWSCGEELLQYSCDPVLNEMIIKHKQEYAQLKVLDLATYDVTVERAIFNSYEPAKKREVWLDKLNYLLANEDFTDAEYAHVAKLIPHIKENYFDPDAIKAEMADRTIFINDWVSYAKASLGWTDKYIAFIIYRLYTKTEQLDAELNAINQLRIKAIARGEYDCDCHITEDWCGGSNCGTGPCDYVSSGCGTFWLKSCDGMCRGV